MGVIVVGTFPGLPSVEATADAVVGAVRDAEPGTDVLLLAPDATALAAARTAKLALDEGSIAIVDYAAPRTLFHLAATALTHLPEGTLGLAPAVIEAVAEATTTKVLLSSVRGLSRPSPSFGMHLRSFLPRASFVCDLAADAVAPGTVLDLPPGLAVVTNASTPRLEVGSLPATEVPLEPNGDRWGSRQWFEATVLRAELDRLVSLVIGAHATAAAARCVSCYRIGTGRSCLFCCIPLAEHAALTAPEGPR